MSTPPTPPPPKRLIVLTDGTSQSATRGDAQAPTNIKLFADSLSSHDPVTGHAQIAFYQSGIGTGSKVPFYVALTAGTGLGINNLILDAYHFLATNYCDGDEIFLFGFSRGGFAVRVLANLVVRLGLFKKEYSYMMRKAWAQYAKEDKGANFAFFLERMWREDPEKTRRVRVRGLGVWDTVGSVGLPDMDWVRSAGWKSSYEFYTPDLVDGKPPFLRVICR